MLMDKTILESKGNNPRRTSRLFSAVSAPHQLGVHISRHRFADQVRGLMSKDCLSFGPSLRRLRCTASGARGRRVSSGVSLASLTDPCVMIWTGPLAQQQCPLARSPSPVGRTAGGQPHKTNVEQRTELLLPVVLLSPTAPPLLQPPPPQPHTSPSRSRLQLAAKEHGACLALSAKFSEATRKVPRAFWGWVGREMGVCNVCKSLFKKNVLEMLRVY